MDSNTLSIIIPIYNSEMFLSKAIESVRKQSLDNIEIILIDDGSTDNSGIICEQYAAIDNRIKVIHKANAGLGAARIDGIRLAKGEFIGFLDSDDWVDESLYEHLYNKAKEYESIDIVISGYVEENENSTVSVFSKDSVLTMNSQESLVRMFESISFNWSLVDKIYKRTLFFKNANLMTNWPSSYGEDTFANWILFNEAKQILYVPEYGYHYRIHSESMMRKGNLIGRLAYFDIYNEIIEGKKYLLKENLAKLVLKTAINTCIPLVYEMQKEYDVYSIEIAESIRQLLKYKELLNNIGASQDLSKLEKLFKRILKNKEECILAIQKRDKELLEFADHKSIYLFGAGSIAKEIFLITKKLHISIKGIVVTDNQIYRNQLFFGKKIESIKDVIGQGDKFILAMNEKYTNEVKEQLLKYDSIKVLDAGKYSIYY